MTEMSDTADAWLASPEGRYVVTWECRKIGSIVADIFGYHALQLGFPQVDLLNDNRIPLRQRAGQGAGAQIVCDPHFLPFAEQSVDLIVMPHMLEFAVDPHQVLREVERVLIPEGQLLLTGFNPMSLWGLTRRIRRFGRSQEQVTFPWNGCYLSVSRLRDWLSLLGLVVEGGCFGCFAPPCTQETWLRRFTFMEPAGDRWWGVYGGVYLLHARKRVAGMNLLRPAWRDQRTREKALVPSLPK